MKCHIAIFIMLFVMSIVVLQNKHGAKGHFIEKLHLVNYLQTWRHLVDWPKDRSTPFRSCISSVVVLYFMYMTVYIVFMLNRLGRCYISTYAVKLSAAVLKVVDLRYVAVVAVKVVRKCADD